MRSGAQWEVNELQEEEEEAVRHSSEMILGLPQGGLWGLTVCVFVCIIQGRLTDVSVNV